MSNIPAELKYVDTHEWRRAEADGTITVGITDGNLFVLVERGEGIAIVGDSKDCANVLGDEPRAVWFLEYPDGLAIERKGASGEGAFGFASGFRRPGCGAMVLVHGDYGLVCLRCCCHGFL